MSITVGPRIIEYLRIKLTKEVQIHHNENYSAWPVLSVVSQRSPQQNPSSHANSGLAHKLVGPCLEPQAAADLQVGPVWSGWTLPSNPEWPGKHLYLVA